MLKLPVKYGHLHIGTFVHMYIHWLANRQHCCKYNNIMSDTINFAKFLNNSVIWVGGNEYWIVVHENNYISQLNQ